MSSGNTKYAKWLPVSWTKVPPKLAMLAATMQAARTKASAARRPSHPMRGRLPQMSRAGEKQVAGGRERRRGGGERHHREGQKHHDTQISRNDEIIVRGFMLL